MTTPKPGPRPTPGARPGAHIRTTVTAAKTATNPAEFGRIDDTGAVFVRTSTGERKIGEWQAGTPQEGLAHYAARFDDLATEVSLLETRLAAHPEDAEHIKKKASQLNEEVPSAAVIGDIDSLINRLETIISSSDAAAEQVKQEKQAHRVQAIARKEELVAEVENIAETSTDWKIAGDRISAILTEWKTIRGIDRKTDDELWKRYSKARDSFNRRRGSHFAELDRVRATARKIKEDIVARAEELKDSNDWSETARKYRGLMDEWKAAGRAPRDIDDKLWEAFRAAKDHFFNARNEVNTARDQEFEANAQAKDALLAEYDQLIDPEKGLDQARRKLAELQEKWEAIGYVPRNKVREYEDKIHAVEKRVTQAADAQWRRTDPAAQARASQFLDKVKDFTAQAEQAEAKGNTTKAAELRQQAQQWQEWADAALNAVENR
ncbi:Domain of Uncharacterised Function (DUF349) [Corynebacterium kutscheri]|uniref:Domain of Uncharacterized Function (DUF349) n=1 Tax=Corynebacterium kutscheri TaxID=35755 RepID=A0A0F6TD84_9CORY|nr:DUF349 domain-containing protein [Corynebacterium kutscheri]AKE41406.1 protein of unknown function (DUF349) [Corynebacterium kutscheri]VEH08683.1 Domain of Uncharacterised Function (DUF349) [Corynebacterium kutscheri]VEH09730.1 Domain of Uncharacterised Function (DUF349) [Corynebacterium kutscheri]VEH79813.1 Domain of Uncharacterised Function (DUF349) [Corynebacterium kutscheri]